MTHHLVGVAEIAELLGVTRQRVDRIVKTSADFPSAEVELSAGRVWKREDVEAWVRLHPDRRRGRPRASEADP